MTGETVMIRIGFSSKNSWEGRQAGVGSEGGLHVVVLLGRRRRQPGLLLAPDGWSSMMVT